MNGNTWIIDRFEDEFVIVEMPDGKMLKLPAALLQGMSCKEGDVLSLSIDDGETQRRRKKINCLMDDLFED